MTSKVKSFLRILRKTEGLKFKELDEEMSRIRSMIPGIDEWRLPFDLSYHLMENIPEDFSSLYIPLSRLDRSLIEQRRYLYLDIKPNEALELSSDIAKYRDGVCDYAIEIKRPFLLNLTFVEDLGDDHPFLESTHKKE